MLPGDAAGALDMEVDMEWYGGGFITIETRIDVRDQIAQEKVASQMAKSGSSVEARQAAGTKKTGSGTIMFSSISLKLWMPDFCVVDIDELTGSHGMKLWLLDFL
jgi:hypothetical protein